MKRCDSGKDALRRSDSPPPAPRTRPHASVVGKALGRNDVTSRRRGPRRPRARGRAGRAAAALAPTRARSRSLSLTRLDHHIGYMPMLYRFFFFFLCNYTEE